MLLKYAKLTASVLFLVLCMIQISASYKTEIEITPAPPEETTTKKSGFFGGIKKWFGGSSQTTVNPLLEASSAKPAASVPTPVLNNNNQKPPPLVIANAPMAPLGPRPDTPASSPFGVGPPQWPQGSTSTTTASPAGKQPNSQQLPQPHPAGGFVSTTTTLKPHLLPGFAHNHPHKSQPSGIDLSYGGAFNAGGYNQHGGKPGFGLAPITTPSTTTTTTSTSSPTSTTTSHPQQLDIGVNKPVSHPSKPNIPSVKEDFPALPTPKSPSHSPSSPVNPSSPSAWNKPLPTPVVNPSASTTTVRSPLPKAPAAGVGGGAHNAVSFVPHASTTTTVRPGFEKEGNSLATDDEIRSLTETLYTKDVNSQLNFVTVRPQGKTRSIDSTDEAPQSLLEVDPKALESPTIAKMLPLFNNYEKDTLVNEYVTPLERQEENAFVDAVVSTNVMRQAMLFLQNKGIVTPDPKSHRDLIKELWFTQYSRGNGKIGSSGFEHVFVNEVKNGTIIGLHNWVYFYEEEKAGNLDYKGYLNQLDLGNKGKILKVRFTHNGLNKPVNTLFIGTSPELELALYTVCFKLRPDRTCSVSLDNQKFGIITYSWRYRGKNLIGSAYPEI